MQGKGTYKDKGYFQTLHKTIIQSITQIAHYKIPRYILFKDVTDFPMTVSIFTCYLVPTYIVPSSSGHWKDQKIRNEGNRKLEGVIETPCQQATGKTENERPLDLPYLDRTEE